MDLEDGNCTTVFQAAQRTTLPQPTDNFLTSKIHLPEWEYNSAGPNSLFIFCLYPVCTFQKIHELTHTGGHPNHCLFPHTLLSDFAALIIINILFMTTGKYLLAIHFLSFLPSSAC